jgi:hypothetical protein
MVEEEKRTEEKDRTMYNTMWTMFQNGMITEAGWMNFANWYMWNVVMVQPNVVNQMKRMKHL